MEQLLLQEWLYFLILMCDLDLLLHETEFLGLGGLMWETGQGNGLSSTLFSFPINS